MINGKSTETEFGNIFGLYNTSFTKIVKGIRSFNNTKISQIEMEYRFYSIGKLGNQAVTASLVLDNQVCDVFALFFFECYWLRLHGLHNMLVIQMTATDGKLTGIEMDMHYVTKM